MTNTIDDCQRQYHSLDNSTKGQFLARLIFYLTEAARGYYPEADKGDKTAVTTLQAINELNHRTAVQLKALLDPASSGYPEAAYWQILRQNCEGFAHQKIVEWALRKSV